MNQISYEKLINDLNSSAAELAIKNKQDRNYIHFFRPHNKCSLNIVGSFKASIAKESNALTSENEPVPQESCDNFTACSRNSFGIVASKDFPEYRDDALSENSYYSSFENFEEYVSSHASGMFCIDNDEISSRKYKYSVASFQKALYARCLIANIWCFSFQFSYIEPALLGDLRESKEVFIYDMENDGSTTYVVCGRPSDGFINERANYKLTFSTNSESTTFGNLYRKENIELFKSKNPSLYSGVIPRLISVQHNGATAANNTMEQLELTLGRTSYMTIMGLHTTINNRYVPELLEHPYLTGFVIDEVSLSDINKYFDKMERTIQREYMENINASKNFTNELAAINKYLSTSLNVHNINISGNIISSDNYCVYTKRSNKVTDSGNIYCSVNGGSEINDSSVDYYSHSTPEDKPTIEYSTAPVYFGGELTRESIAELGTNDSSPYWKYYGLTCMCHYAENDADTNSLWMHFNVLGEKNCSYSLEQIDYMRKHATESFENKNIKGYQLRVFKDRSSLRQNYSVKFISFLLEYSDIWVLISIAIAGFLHRDQTTKIADFLIENSMSLILALLAIILLLLKCRHNAASSKIYTSFTITTDSASYNKNFETELKNKIVSDKLDLIFYVLAYMFLIDSTVE